MLSQQRGYHIPLKVKRPRTPYSSISGRPAPKPWPEFERVPQPAKTGSELRWNRTVVRFPNEVEAQLLEDERALVLSGKAGTIRLDLKALDPTGLLAYRTISLGSAQPASAQPAAPAAAAGKAAAAGAGGNAAPTPPAPAPRMLLALLSPNKERFSQLTKEISAAVRGVMTGYLVGLTVKGVGYRMEPVEEGAVQPPTSGKPSRDSRNPSNLDNKPRAWYFEAPPGSGAVGAGAVPAAGGGKGAAAGAGKGAAGAAAPITFPYPTAAPAVRLKVGYSRTAVYVMPPGVRAFFPKPTLLYLYGLRQEEVARVAEEIRAIRKPNAYTGNGIQYVDEVIKLKQRAAAK